MKWPLQSVILLSGASVILVGYSPDAYEEAHVRLHDEIDSALVISQNIRKLKAVKSTIEIEVLRWDWDGPDNNRRFKNVQTTWTTFDKSGRVVSIDDTIVNEKYERTEITREKFTYEGTKLVERQLQLRYLYTKDEKKDSTVRIEIVKWSDGLTWRHFEWGDYGVWIVHIDSTILTPEGKPHITYTHNSLHDSFVEEYVYDAGARLKYRRLAMKQFWSPPWEMESSNYTYNDDGSWTQLDSVWRIDPDMNAARRLAGNPAASDYDWEVLLAAPSVCRINRFEQSIQHWYDTHGRLTRSLEWDLMCQVWDDYNWVYNEKGQLIHHNERRGQHPEKETNPCLDSVWYTYMNGVLHEKTGKYYCNNNSSDEHEVYMNNGKPCDPERTERVPYSGMKKNYKWEVKKYHENQLQTIKYYDTNGLILASENELDFYETSSVTEYTYMKW